MALLIAFICYLTLLVLINSQLANRVKHLGDFFLAGKRFGPWPIAISVVSSWFGAASTIGQMQKLNQFGLSALWSLVIPSLLACSLVTGLFANRIARQPFLSLPEAIDHAYGRWARLGLAITVLASNTAFIGAELIAAGALFEQVLHIPKIWALVGFGSMIVVYATMAGFWTVVLTDFCHFVLFTAALLILFGSVVFSPAAPLMQVWQHPPTPDFWNWFQNPAHSLALTMVFVLGWSIDPLMWQRMSAIKTPGMASVAAGRATAILSLLFVTVICIGFASPAVLGPGRHPAVLVSMAQTLPGWLSLATLLGIMTALASTIDSCLNISSLTLTHDGFQVFMPTASRQLQLWVARITTGLMLIPAVWIALNHQDIIEVLWFSADIYVCALFFPMMGILFTSVTDSKPSGLRQAGTWAMAAGLLTLVVNDVMRPLNTGIWLFDYPYSTLFGFTMSGLAFWLGWLRTPQTLAPEQTVLSSTDQNDYQPVAT